jgi:hypothetical protein
MQATRLALYTRSEANAHEHWRKRQKRAKEQRGLTALFCRTSLAKPPIPCTVRLTRVAPRALDDDNLAGALKHVRDGVADWLGVNDRRSDLVRYEYAQSRGQPREYAVMVEVLGGNVNG